MKAHESKRCAADVLRYIRETYNTRDGVHACIGYAWSALAEIAGDHGPAPWDDGARASIAEQSTAANQNPNK